MQPSLSTAIDGLYEAFRTVPKPRAIDGCPCCIQKVDRCRLLESPVRTIDPQTLSPFAFKAMTTVGAAGDLRYFVPRILEVCAEDPHWWPDVEIVMDRVTMAGWHSWPSRERAAIEALVEAVLASARAAGDGSGVLDAWICAASIAGIDVTGCLEAMLDPTCRPALLAYWELNAREVAERASAMRIGRGRRSWSGASPTGFAPIGCRRRSRQPTGVGQADRRLPSTSVGDADPPSPTRSSRARRAC